MAGKSMAPGGGGQFAKLKGKLKKKGAYNPAALAAYIGRKVEGKATFQAQAAAGKRRANK